MVFLRKVVPFVVVRRAAAFAPAQHPNLACGAGNENAGVAGSGIR
jgi:hypothetical protein